MNLTNQEIINVYVAMKEIAGCVKAKEKITNSGKDIYQIIKKINELTPIVNEVNKKDQEFQAGAKASITPENEKEITDALNIDRKKLYDEAREVKLHQISRADWEIYQKELSQISTIHSLNYLVRGEEYQEPKPEVKEEIKE